MTGNLNELNLTWNEMWAKGWTADQALEWVAQLPEDSPFFMKEPRNPEFSTMEQEMISRFSTATMKTRKTTDGLDADTM